LRVYLINLDRDTDRLAHMQAELAARDIAVERFPACLGAALPERFRPAFEPPAGEAQVLTPGEIGCYASHLAIMERVAVGDEPALVLEDDLAIGEALPRLLARLDELPADWEMVRLSNPAKSAVVRVGVVGGVGDVVRYWRVPNNTGAYLIRPAGAARFLARAGRRQRAVDEDLRRPWEHGIVMYGVLPPPVTANVLPTSIGGAREAPGRQRFRAAPRHRLAEIGWRIRAFGLLGCLRLWMASKFGRAKAREARSARQP
jgi:glycosyl transferase family 25